MADHKEISMYGAIFTLSTPYAAGHQLTEAEAKALNQVRCENIANNLRKKVAEAKGEAESLSEGKVKALQAEFDKYDQEYEFTLASAGGGRKLDPLEKEARSIARAYVTGKIKEQGKKVKDVPAETIEANITKLIENPKVVELAKKQLAAKRKVADEEFGAVAV